MEVLCLDPGENLAKAGGDGAGMRRFLLEGIAMEKFKATLCYLWGNPRSDDRMTAALWCRSTLGGVILGGTHVIEGPEDGFFGGAVLHLTH